MSAPYKMKGFSGFGNSPAKQTKFPNSPKAKKRKMVKGLKEAFKDYHTEPLVGPKIPNHISLKMDPKMVKKLNEIMKKRKADIKPNMKGASPAKAVKIDMTRAKGEKKKEYTTAQKRRVVEMNKTHKGKPGFQEYADKVFGGKTTFSGPDGMISRTTKDITAKK